MSQDTVCHNDATYAIIAMGSNLPSAAGNPQQTLTAALEKLAEIGLPADLVSEYYENPCFPAGAGPDFVNACARIPTHCSPRAILAALHDVEADFGRKRELRWSARSLDLDLLIYGDLVAPTLPTLTEWMNLPLAAQISQNPNQMILPHPRIQDRAFVLIPLADIAPEWRHPVLHKTVVEMLDDLLQADREAVKRL